MQHGIVHKSEQEMIEGLMTELAELEKQLDTAAIESTRRGERIKELEARLAEANDRLADAKRIIGIHVITISDLRALCGEAAAFIGKLKPDNDLIDLFKRLEAVSGKEGK